MEFRQSPSWPMFIGAVILILAIGALALVIVLAIRMNEQAGPRTRLGGPISPVREVTRWL